MTFCSVLAYVSMMWLTSCTSPTVPPRLAVPVEQMHMTFAYRQRVVPGGYRYCWERPRTRCFAVTDTYSGVDKTTGVVHAYIVFDLDAPHDFMDYPPEPIPPYHGPKIVCLKGQLCRIESP